jgi:general secretion pathway protein D
MARAKILAGFLCLALTTSVRAQTPAPPDPAASEENATLLALPLPEAPPALAVENPRPGSQVRRDSAVKQASLTEQAAVPGQPGSTDVAQAIPSIAPLPLGQTQPTPPTAEPPPPAGAATQTTESGAGAGQPRGRTTQPGGQTTQPGARPSQAQGRPPMAAPARGNQPANRPGPDLTADIRFDQDGLITMHVNELDVRVLLEFLSRRSGANILVSPRVTGTITANFEGVTLQKVIDAIIKLANLVDKVDGSIHYIYTKEELQDEAEFTKKERILTKVYKLSYVRADEILGVIRPFLSPDVGMRRISVTPSYRFGISESATFVSGGGQAMSAGGGGGGGAAGGGTGGPGGSPPSGGGPTIGGFQPPTGGNSIADYDHLIIQDYESNLKIIDQIIQRIDVRPIQVLIEAVIISVDYEHDRELGVNMGLVDNLGTALGTVGNGAELNGNVGFTPLNLLTTGGKIAQGPVTDAQGFTSSTYNGVKFGFVSNNVTGFIRALETIGNTKILASPRILVLNKQRAEIQLGARLGFQTLSQNFTSTIQQVQFLNTGTLLRLRPFVSDDGMVRMEIHPERSSGTVTNNIPNQQTAELTTNVMVPDGATLVIGGLIEDEDDYSYQGLPLLSRFPALGFLTGINQKTEGRRELVVLLTPHIWSIERSMAHAPSPHANGAFGASGPVVTGSTSFDLETGGAGAGDGARGAMANTPMDPSGNAVTGVVPGAMATAGLPGGPGQAQADPRTIIASSGAPSQPGNPVAASGTDTDPNNAAAQQRRRRFSLRDWLSRRSRDKQGDPSAGGGAVGQPLARGPAGAPIPPAADPAAATPQAASPSGTGPDGRPLPTPQQPAAPDSERPNLDLGPEAERPIGAASNERIPRRDDMLALAAWRPDRAGKADGTPRADEDRAPTLAAAETEGAATNRVVAGPRRHTIVPGETLPSIARRYYGSDRYAESLGQFNQGRIARGGLQPGDLLVIPPREDLSGSGGWVEASRARSLSRTPSDGAAVVTARSPWPGRDQPNEPSRSRPRAVYHVIGPGETPRSIARERLGDAGRAREIIDLNQARLAAEGRWRPGLRILLPPDAEPLPKTE